MMPYAYQTVDYIHPPARLTLAAACVAIFGGCEVAPPPEQPAPAAPITVSAPAPADAGDELRRAKASIIQAITANAHGSERDRVAGHLADAYSRINSALSILGED